MKGTTGIFFLALIALSNQRMIQQRQAAAGAGAIALEIAMPAIQKLVNALGDHLANVLFGKDPYTTILHRTVMLTESGNSVTIKDVASGITISRSGNNAHEALAKATQDFITTLVEGGFISTHDLHLAPVTTSTQVPCGDNFPQVYCSRQKSNGYCSPRSHLYDFMKDNCFKTCSNC